MREIPARILKERLVYERKPPAKKRRAVSFVVRAMVDRLVTEMRDQALASVDAAGGVVALFNDGDLGQKKLQIWPRPGHVGDIA